MDTEIDDHAFPTSTSHIVQQRGMTLRDYFAGQALMGSLANSTRHANFSPNDLNAYCSVTADVAYSMADAMIAEREKGEK